MKNKRVVYFLCMIAVAFSMLIGTANISYADTYEDTYYPSSMELEGVDESKIVTIKAGKSITSTSKNVQTVTRITNGTLYDTETGQYVGDEKVMKTFLTMIQIL